MSTVREPRSETADPFGDHAAFPPPDVSARAPEPDVALAPHDVATGGGFGEILANAAGYGIAKLIVVGVIFAASTFGYRVFGNISNDGPPNVPIHITTECQTAYAAVDGIGSLGVVSTYEQSGSDSVITFDQVGGETVTCTYDMVTGEASIS